MKILTLVLCLALPLAAQEPPSGGQRPPRMSYDRSKEVTLQGTVSSMHTRSQGPGKLVSLTLQTSNSAAEITVGPDFLLQSKNFTIASGDELTVIAAPMGNGYVARQITRGTETLTLLDENGRPTGGPDGQGAPNGAGGMQPPPQN